MDAKVAVIILNWNGEKLLQEFLPLVMANTDESVARIIVADNGSTDASLQVIKEKFPGVEVMSFDKNYGYAGGYNMALRDVRQPYTVLLNSDVAPGKGWIGHLLDYMESHPDTGACQPKVLDYKNPARFEYAGACGGYIDRNGYTYCRGRIFGTCEIDHGQYNTPADIFWATGAALMVRTDLYREVGGLDEMFFAHMEEIDLCWRILLKGWRIAAVPKAVVYHLGGASLPASDPKKTYLNFRNNLLMMHKNLPDDTRERKLFVRKVLDGVAWLKFVLSFDFANARAVWDAHRDFQHIRKKYVTHPCVDLLDSRTDTRRNILVDYYLRRKKHFS